MLKKHVCGQLMGTSATSLLFYVLTNSFISLLALFSNTFWRQATAGPRLLHPHRLIYMRHTIGELAETYNRGCKN